LAEPQVGAAARVLPPPLALPLNTVNAPPGQFKEQPAEGVALCLSGGGYRAMLFHVGALWRLNDAALLSKLSRVSSVSGGSITAAVLGLMWKGLTWSNGVVQNLDQVFKVIRGLADRTIDEGSVIGGLLLPGVSIADRVAAAYDKHLFHGATLQDLPDDSQNQGPRFVLNATNVQTGSLWRFSLPYMGDWQVGLINNPKVTLAVAVGASSAFPPILSPVTLDVSPGDFDPAKNGPLFKVPYNDTVVLSDGGVYDNLGLETAIKRYKTVLVSDGGQRMGPDPFPKGDWAQHGLRITGLVDNQVRSLRKRQLIEAYRRGDRTGTYWGIASHFDDYARDAKVAGANLSDPLKLTGFDPSAIAGVKTRLKAMPADVQERLINWGFAVCDAALRTHFGVKAEPAKFPYPNRGV
jgi:NTE family protein